MTDRAFILGSLLQLLSKEVEKQMHAGKSIFLWDVRYMSQKHCHLPYFSIFSEARLPEQNLHLLTGTVSPQSAWNPECYPKPAGDFKLCRSQDISEMLLKDSRKCWLPHCLHRWHHSIHQSGPSLNQWLTPDKGYDMKCLSQSHCPLPSWTPLLFFLPGVLTLLQEGRGRPYVLPTLPPIFSMNI